MAKCGVCGSHYGNTLVRHAMICEEEERAIPMRHSLTNKTPLKLKYVMTALGGTFVPVEEGEDDEATQLL